MSSWPSARIEACGGMVPLCPHRFAAFTPGLQCALMRRGMLLAGVLVGAMTGFAAPAMAIDNSVTVGDDFFSPNRVAVTLGGTVTWNNLDSHEEHNVHFPDWGPEPSPPMRGPWTKARTFPTAGKYHYHCDVHGEAMSGDVYVNASGNLPPFVAFSAFPNPAETGQAVFFDATASGDTDGIQSLKWDFGDGSPVVDTGTTRTTSHTYTSAGTFNVNLVVTDTKNNSDDRTIAVQVNVAVPPPPPPPTSGDSAAVVPMIAAATALVDTTLPAVTNYGVTNRSFRVDKASTPTSGQAAAAKGTTFRYSLSEPATVKIELQRLLSGRKRGRRCVKPTAQLRKAKKCVRVASVGTLTRTSRTGANAVPFTGRVGSRALAAGSYQAVLTATDAAGNRSARKTVSFKIVRR